jgi:outer membrane protein TolC
MPVLGDPDELEAQAPNLRPDVQAAVTNVGVAEDNHRVTWLNYFPSLGFTARYQIQNVTGFTGRYDTWAFIVGLNWTLFDGLNREAQLRENAAKITEARAVARAAASRAKDEVRQALYNLKSATANRVKAQEQARLARENVQLVKVNSDAGAATYLEVSDAAANLLQAELTVVAETLNAQLSVLRLARATGRWKP